MIVCTGTEAKVAAVELPGGALIKVDPRATPTEFLQAASACNGQAAAAALIGQVVAAGGPPKAPLVLLASYAEVVKSCCSVMLFGCEGSDAALKSACAYILLPPYPGLLYLALFYLSPCPLPPPLLRLGNDRATTHVSTFSLFVSR